MFRSLTDAAQQMQWWNNDVCKVSVFEMDARVGGKWRFESADPTGKLERRARIQSSWRDC